MLFIFLEKYLLIMHWHLLRNFVEVVGEMKTVYIVTNDQPSVSGSLLFFIWNP